MTFRFRAAMVEPSSENIGEIDAHLAALVALRERYEDYEYVSADGVKLFADAVLEGNPMTSPPTLPVAAMLDGFKQPIFGGSIEDGTFDVVGYVDPERESCQAVQDDPDTYLESGRMDDFVSEFGFLSTAVSPAERSSGARRSVHSYLYSQGGPRAGFHVHVHALADKGVRIAVDELGKVKEIADGNGTSQSLAHVQIAHPDDQKKIGEYGISVVLTFVWATPGVQYEMMVVPFIDEIERGLPICTIPTPITCRTFIRQSPSGEYGGILVNGSDAPVGNRDPIALYQLAAGSLAQRWRGSAECRPAHRHSCSH